MVGLLILKQLEILSDDRVFQTWIENSYFQAFCGERIFQWDFPCPASDLAHFRNRIGEAGAKKVFQLSVGVFEVKVLAKEALIEATVQKKNITFPTDAKLQVKVIGRLWKITRQKKIQLRRSFVRELKQIICMINFNRSPKKINLWSSHAAALEALSRLYCV